MFKYLFCAILLIAVCFFLSCSDGGSGSGGVITHTVIFNLNAGEGNSSTVPQTVLQGQSATRPETDPSREGFTFGGWFTVRIGGNLHDFDSPITQNTTVWARWMEIPTPQIPEFTVSFDLNGGEGNLSTVAQTVLQDQSATRPAINPIREDFAFVDWYSEQTGGSPYDFESPITQNTTVWARWTKVSASQLPEFRVNFDLNIIGGSSSMAGQTVLQGQRATRPETDPIREYFTFEGWYTTRTGGNLHDFDSPITQNIVLYARWARITYTVTWNADGGSPAPTQTSVTHDGRINFPAAMTKNGYRFDGWFSDEALTQAATFPQDNVTSDRTFWAKWVVLPEFTVTWNADGGIPAPTQTSVFHGGRINSSAAMTKNGYSFGGWFSDEAFTQAVTFPINNVTSDRTFWAMWTEITNAVIGEERTVNVGGTSIDVIFVSAGRFMMGDREIQGNGIGLGEVTRHVTLTRGFWIGKYPVTQAQYRAVMSNNPSHFRDSIRDSNDRLIILDRPNNPVESITWFNATEFASRVGGRLPTEAEWEFAARGGNKSQGFIYSGSNNLDVVGWFSDNSSSSTQAVGQKLPNELGIYDMSGNVFEWTGDWFEVFGWQPVINPMGPSTDSGGFRVMRGGSHRNIARVCLVAARNLAHIVISVPIASHFDNTIGFRVVFDVLDEN